MATIPFRPNDILLDDIGPTIGKKSIALNPAYGGAFGWTPDYKNMLSKQAHVRRHVVPVLVKAPGFIRFMPQPDVWYKTIKMIMETHPETIEGLNATIEVTADQHNFGGGGQQYHEPVDAKMAQSEITQNYVDTYGYGLSRTLQYWIDYAILNSETKSALVGTLPKFTADDTKAWLADEYSCIMMYYEPDPLHRRVQRAWLIGNMWPLSSGDITGKSDKANAMEIAKLSIKFTGFTQHTDGVTRFAQRYLDQIKWTNADPWRQPAFIEEISGEIANLPGWKSTVEDLANAVSKVK